MAAKKLYVGTMNDGAFIIDQPPRPAPADHHNPNAMSSVIVVAALGSDFDLAGKLVKAWNDVLDLPWVAPLPSDLSEKDGPAITHPAHQLIFEAERDFGNSQSISFARALLIVQRLIGAGLLRSSL